MLRGTTKLRSISFSCGKTKRVVFLSHASLSYMGFRTCLTLVNGVLSNHNLAMNLGILEGLQAH